MVWHSMSTPPVELPRISALDPLVLVKLGLALVALIVELDVQFVANILPRSMCWTACVLHFAVVREYQVRGPTTRRPNYKPMRHLVMMSANTIAN